MSRIKDSRLRIKFFRNSVFLILFSIFLLNAYCFAEDVRFEVTVDKTRVGVGETIYLSLNFYGTQSVATPYFPGVDGFDWQYLGPSKKTSIINGVVSSSITHRYRLKALRDGEFKIPAFTIQYRGKSYTSEAITVKVVSAATRLQGAQGAATTKAQGLEERLFITIESDKRKAYVNELIPISVKLYANSLTVKDIQYPELTHDGFFMDEFKQPKQYQKSVGGVLHNVIEFNTNISATRAGELELGPAELVCKILIREKTSRRSTPFFFDFGFDDDFFGAYKTYPMTLEAPEISITAVSLPEEGKPDNFSGALGDYSFSVYSDAQEVQIGDPITLKMKIQGEGNMKTVIAPLLEFGDDFKVYEPEISQVGNLKIFEQIIIPTNDRIDEIPQIDFSFFDPKSSKYKTITQGAIGIKVTPLAKGEELKIFDVTREGQPTLRRKEILGRAIIYIKDTPGTLKRKGTFLYKNRLFIMLQFLPLSLILAAVVFQRRKERMQADIGYARGLRAESGARRNLRALKRLLDSGSAKQFFDQVFKALQQYLGDKFHLPTAGITANVVEDLKSRNVEPNILAKLKECFLACDMARYAASSITKEQMQRSFGLLKEIIDNLERMKR